MRFVNAIWGIVTGWGIVAGWSIVGVVRSQYLTKAGEACAININFEKLPA